MVEKCAREYTAAGRHFRTRTDVGPDVPNSQPNQFLSSSALQDNESIQSRLRWKALFCLVSCVLEKSLHPALFFLAACISGWVSKNSQGQKCFAARKGRGTSYFWRSCWQLKNRGLRPVVHATLSFCCWSENSLPAAASKCFQRYLKIRQCGEGDRALHRTTLPKGASHKAEGLLNWRKPRQTRETEVCHHCSYSLPFIK